jgi:glycosyltransferase involved in cell wall biosynthesis
MPALSIVLPAFEEQDAVVRVVEELRAALDDAGEDSREIIVVDDGSRDATWDAVLSLAGRHGDVRGVRLSRNFGHQGALLAGLSEASGDAVVMLDADGQHPPSLVPELVRRWRSGARVVQTLRRDPPRLPLFKRLTSRTYYRVFSRLTGVELSAGAADFRLVDRETLLLILRHPQPARFLRGFLAWTGLATEFVPFEAAERLAGRTKYTLTKMLALAREGLVRFSTTPLRWAARLSLASALAATAAGAWMLTAARVEPRFVAGLLSIVVGVQLLAWVVFSEYAGMTGATVQGLPAFVVRERTRAHGVRG